MTKQCQIRTQQLPGEQDLKADPRRLGGQALEVGGQGEGGESGVRSLSNHRNTVFLNCY